MQWHWYLKRLSAMGPREIANRVRDRIHERRWKTRYHARDATPAMELRDIVFRGGLPRTEAESAPLAARDALLAVADGLLEGRWDVFDIARSDVTGAVDWHWDARHDVHLPPDLYSFDPGLRPSTCDPKYVWELSRHHQTTVLAMAFWLTGDERYAHAAVTQIGSWIDGNPFLHGIHWSSGIEIGMRLIAFVWVRRLLDSWPQVRTHFEENSSFVESVYLHQWLLAQHHSYGSSANNHLLYEITGLFVASSAMPWFSQSAQWQAQARAILEREFPRQVFASGYTRELATAYDAFVLDALLLCLVESEIAEAPFGPDMWSITQRMGACLADIRDAGGTPPRQGDSDDAWGFLLDAPRFDRWADLVDLTQFWFADDAPEQRRAPQTLRGWLLASLAVPPLPAAVRPSPAADAGLVILRAQEGSAREIWCSFDAGPHGYLSIAAHAHADALSFELRLGGRPVFVDPGTYAYAGPWRDYFRSTTAHNTLELGGIDQSASGGPFLWTRHAGTRILELDGVDCRAPFAIAAAEHDGYLGQNFRGRHRRSLTLDRVAQRLAIRDEVTVSKPVAGRLLFHLHPDIACTLEGNTAVLRVDGESMRVDLPAALAWQAVRASEAPMLGWYSPRYGVKQPATTLAGSALLRGRTMLETIVHFPTAP